MQTDQTEVEFTEAKLYIRSAEDEVIVTDDKGVSYVGRKFVVLDSDLIVDGHIASNSFDPSEITIKGRKPYSDIFVGTVKTPNKLVIMNFNKVEKSWIEASGMVTSLTIFESHLEISGTFSCSNMHDTKIRNRFDSKFDIQCHGIDTSNISGDGTVLCNYLYSSTIDCSGDVIVNNAMTNSKVNTPGNILSMIGKIPINGDSLSSSDSNLPTEKIPVNGDSSSSSSSSDSIPNELKPIECGNFYTDTGYFPKTVVNAKSKEICCDISNSNVSANTVFVGNIADKSTVTASNYIDVQGYISRSTVTANKGVSVGTYIRELSNVTSTNGSVSVGTYIEKHSSVTASWRVSVGIYIGEGSNVTSTNGNVSVGNYIGENSVVTANGSVSVGIYIGRNSNVTSTNGSVSVGTYISENSVVTANGNVSVGTYIAGRSHVTASGCIKVPDYIVNAVVTANGSIYVGYIEGLSVVTAKGDITIIDMIGPNCTVTTDGKVFIGTDKYIDKIQAKQGVVIVAKNSDDSSTPNDMVDDDMVDVINPDINGNALVDLIGKLKELSASDCVDMNSDST